MREHLLEHLLIPGPVGAIETVIEHPVGVTQGLALVAHPHPLYGGSMENKVVTTLARLLRELGYSTVRSNFRGVGQSQGQYDEGIGETEDLLAVTAFVAARHPGLAWSLLGFSFGAFVVQQLSTRIAAERLIMVAPAVSMRPFTAPGAPAHILQGDADEIIPLAAVAEYAERYAVPLTVIPAAGHFFHGKLIDLREAAKTALSDSADATRPAADGRA